MKALFTSKEVREAYHIGRNGEGEFFFNTWLERKLRARGDEE